MFRYLFLVCTFVIGCNDETSVEETQEENDSRESLDQSNYASYEKDNYEDCKSFVYKMEFNNEQINFVLPKMCPEYYIDRGDPQPDSLNPLDEVYNPNIYYSDT